MDMYQLKFTRLQNEIFRLLCIKSGEQLNQRNIAKLLKVSPTAVAKAVKGLGTFIEIEKSQIMISIKLSSNATHLKRVENLRLIYESGLVDFLIDRFPGCTIVLFGSYSVGEDTVKSDIDIAVIGSKGKSADLAKFERMLERTITLHFYEDFKINKNLKSNIINGITMNGALEL